jgi:hypothetical protein
VEKEILKIWESDFIISLAGNNQLMKANIDQHTLIMKMKEKKEKNMQHTARKDIEREIIR